MPYDEETQRLESTRTDRGDEPELGLRARKARDTRWALSDATLALAFERGLENVRREDIAARANVSVRTFTNYFSNKFEAIGYRQVERLERSIELLRSYPRAMPLWDAITAAVVTPLEADGATRPPLPAQIAEVRKLMDAPEVHAAMMRRIFGADGELAAAVAERTGTDPTTDLYPRMVAGAVGIAFEAAFFAYAHADPPRPIPAFLRHTLGQIAAGLPDPSARA